MVSEDLPPADLLVWPFPMPGRLLTLAYRELDIAAEGTDEQKEALGPVSDLPRPWDPGTCIHPKLRRELWTWLEDVVIWLNHEYVFDPVDAIPPCWPRHQHLVHEIAVLADQRRKAIYSFAGDALEEWHRYSLPQFLERLKRRVGDQCNEGHPTSWPANGRFIHHLNDPAAMQRHAMYAADLKASPWGPRRRTRQIVDPETGEILE